LDIYVRLLNKSKEYYIMKKYAMIQIDAELHSSLKEFCKNRGYKISGLVESLIKDKIEPIQNTLPKKVLSTKI